jgi:hypothetical protein
MSNLKDMTEKMEYWRKLYREERAILKSCLEELEYISSLNAIMLDEYDNTDAKELVKTIKAYLKLTNNGEI